MASKYRTSNSSSVVPEARAALDQFKMEAAAEVGVNLKDGYNGDLTSREAGSVGGQMVKKMSTIRPTKKRSYDREIRTVEGHKFTVTYIAGIAI